MKRTHLLIVILSALALTIVPCRAFAFFGAEAAVGVWNQAPSGTIGYKKISAADDIDLKNDMNLGSENQLFARVKVELPLILPNIYFMATPMSFTGNGSKNATFNFGGQTFTAGVPIESKVKLDHYDLALFYPIPLLKTATAGILNIEFGLDARQIVFEGTISGGGLTASKTLTTYLPMAYAGVQIKPISLFAIEGEVRGIAYGKNSYIDYIARVKVHPLPLLFVAGGYRAETVDLDIQDVKADVNIAGPFAEIGISF